jgi:tetratricopeptide (TPR) repeat protein
VEVTPRRASRQRDHAFAWALAFALAVLVPRIDSARADAKSEARTTFELGVEASRAQRWDDARTQFRRSLELLPKASTMFNLAVADIKLGLGREALEQLDAFERAASQEEHSQMLERAQVLRPQAQALVESEQATAQSGGNVLSQTDDGFTDEVRQTVQQAREDYGRGKDREALVGFERAYKSSRRAELLYNIGVVADRLREDRKAARAYDQFVAALPDAPEAAVAQVRSDSLHATLAEREKAGEEAARARPPEVTVTPIETDLVKPRVFLVVGPALIAASAVSLILLANQKADYDKCLEKDSGCTNRDEVRSDRTLVLVGMGAMAAVAASGAVFTIAGGIQLSRRKRALDRAFAVLPAFAAAPGGAMVGLSGRF